MKERKVTETLIQAFEEHLKENEKRPATIEKYARDVRAFCIFAGESIVSKELTLKYKEMLRKKYAVASANSMLAALNAFYDFAGWRDCCVKAFKIQKRAYCSEERELSRAEYFRLVAAAKCKGDDRLHLILQTICGTGIRVSELEYITVEAVRCGEAQVESKGKIRKVFLVKNLRQKLKRYIKIQGIREGAVFVTRSGRSVSRNYVWRQMKQLCKAARVAPSKVFPHNLRHLFARIFYESAKDIVKLADVLGHANINTTRIYTVTTGAEHRRRMECMRLIL